LKKCDFETLPHSPSPYANKEEIHSANSFYYHFSTISSEKNIPDILGKEADRFRAWGIAY
jgi:hypothetical protein